MYGRRKDGKTSTPGSPEPGAPWSVRAEFTIRRGDERSSPVEATNRSASIAPTTESSGVLMTYTFTPARGRTSPTAAVSSPATYGFQRGNLLFTSTPPARSLLPVRSHTIPRSAYSSTSHEHQQQQQQQVRPSLPDSGYSSEQPAPGDKRCRSTYSIFLSTAGRAQQPYPRPWSSYSQRQQQQQHPAGCCRFSAVPEVCEDCAETTGGARSFATHFCTRLQADGPGKAAPQVSSRDAASQTTDIEAKLSPVAARRKVRRRNAGALSGSSGRDELKSNNFGRLSKTAASVKSPTPPAEQTASDSSATNTTREDNSEKRKRTVHIDVYCTGTDDDPNEEDTPASSSANAASSSSDDDDNRTQTTVFEGTDVLVTHTQARAGALPRGFQDEKAFLRRATERRCESFKHAPMRMPSLASSKGYESDDVLSSLYPSQFSSYSRLRDFESAASSSVGLAPEDTYDSASATSWKDTVSDLESLINSKSSITPCDSFEYADSLDRERIRRMEAVWSRKAAIRPRNWPEQRRHLLQGRMMREYAEKHPTGWSESESSAADDSAEEEEEVGWSFLSSEENASVVRGKLVLPGGAALVEKSSATSRVVSASTTDQETSQAELIRQVKTSIFRDRIGPFGSTSPSSTPSKVQSRMTSPFTTPQGERTDHIIKASIFGRVVSTFKKPGHHVGPAKNPACSCEHCRRYFEENARGRAGSLDSSERRDNSRATSSTN